MATIDLTDETEATACTHAPDDVVVRIEMDDEPEPEPMEGPSHPDLNPSCSKPEGELPILTIIPTLHTINNVTMRYNSLVSEAKTKTESQYLLERILKRCAWEGSPGGSGFLTIKEAARSSLVIAAAYTGFPYDVMKTFPLDIRCETIEQTIRYRYLIRAVLTSMYFQDILPTTHSLIKTLGSQVPAYWTPSTVRRNLKILGYTWKRFAKTQWRYIVEDPDIVFERFRYLKSIVDIRKENRPVFFIEENFFDSNDHYMKLSELPAYERIYKTSKKPPMKFFVTYVVSEDGVLTSKFYLYHERFDFSEWVLEEVLPLLPALSDGVSSVIVYSEGNRQNESTPKITANSPKADMMEYLDVHSMPYSESMRKAELLQLVRAVRATFSKTSPLEDLIRSHGVEVLRLPPSLRSLTPGSLIFENIRQKLTSKISFPAVTNCLENFDMSCLRSIALEEKEQFMTEKRLDLIMDTLERNIDLRNFTDEDLDSEYSDCEDSY